MVIKRRHPLHNKIVLEVDGIRTDARGVESYGPARAVCAEAGAEPVDMAFRNDGGLGGCPAPPSRYAKSRRVRPVSRAQFQSHK